MKTDLSDARPVIEVSIDWNTRKDISELTRVKNHIDAHSQVVGNRFPEVMS